MVVDRAVCLAVPTITTVPGLTYVADYLPQIEQDELLSTVDSMQWRSDLKRRVQHYGYRYDYTKREVGQDSYLGPLPRWAKRLADRLYGDGLVAIEFNQLIVNEYLPGQGISAHVDCVPCFAGTVVSVSLGSQCVMVMSDKDAKVDLLLQPGSLLIMQGDARYRWRHGIPARKSDLCNGERISRGRRVSLTYREVLAEG